jgi:predicted nucleic acid-binding protein
LSHSWWCDYPRSSPKSPASHCNASSLRDNNRLSPRFLFELLEVLLARARDRKQRLGSRLPVESILGHREISADTAALSHADLLSLRVELFAYEPFATRVWQLRDNVTAYDGWYVALAESLGCTLATLDLRLAKAPGPRCHFATT